jgi:hypothetical protein
MSDLPDLPAAAPVPGPATPAAAVPAAPVKRPGLIRRSAVIVLAVVILLFVLAFPFVVTPWVIAKVKGVLAGQGLELTPESKLSVSIFGGAVNGKDLVLRETGQPNDVLTATTLNADLGVLASISSGDVIIDELTIEGLTGSLRRRGDHVPIITPPDAKPGSGIPTDWLKMAQKAGDWYRQHREERKPVETKPGEPKPAHVPPVKTEPSDWPKSVQYQPAPQPGGHWPRLLIRKLSITGGKIGMPDETPFDVATFSLAGTNVALDLNADEVMDLTGKITTTGAGPLDLALNRKGGENGTLKLAASQMPLAALASKPVSGEALAQYHPQGDAKFSLDTAWTGWNLTGAIDSVLTGVVLSPEKEASSQAQQVAQAVNALKGAPISWPVKLGGLLYAPTITDSGAEAVLKGNATAAATGIVKDKATEKATELLDQQGAKSPAVQGATDKAKDLLKGFGK